MTLQYQSELQQLYVRLDGEIDHHSSKRLRDEIDAAIYTHMPQTLLLDFQEVTFMDSSGIGLIMGRHRILQPLGGCIVLCRPAAHIRRILQLAGMDKLAVIRSESHKEAVQ